MIKQIFLITSSLLIFLLFSCKPVDRASILQLKLKLKESQTGIFYKEIYRSKDTIKQNGLPITFIQDHVFSTNIYYLLTINAKDYFHKLKSDETWSFFEGQPVILTIISPNGVLEKVTIGTKYAYQYTIKAGSWYFAKLEKGYYALLGLTVSPGFEIGDYQLGVKDSLIKQFPQYKDIISQNSIN